MKSRDLLVWAIMLATLAWMAYERKASHPADDCQDFDVIGNGLGCEEPDIADR
jgi:hypothetical protein